jgi:hypothetical protein
VHLFFTQQLSEGVEIGIGMETDKSEFGGSVYGLTNFQLI